MGQVVRQLLELKKENNQLRWRANALEQALEACTRYIVLNGLDPRPEVIKAALDAAQEGKANG
jgi:hypothetical protein